MARKRRGRPKASKGVTYDSKETKFILGILFFGFGVFAFMSYILNDGSSIFSFIRSFVGDATFMLALFSLSLAMRCFGLKFFLTSSKSIFAQGVLTILLAILMAANYSEPFYTRQFSYRGELGGIVGYELAYFSLNYLLLNLTIPVIFFLMAVLLPALFDQNLAEFFGELFTQLKNFSQGLFGKPVVQAKPVEEVRPASLAPATIGGFRDIISRSAERNNKDNDAPTHSNTHTVPEFVGMSANRPRPAAGEAGSTVTDADGNVSFVTTAGGAIVQTELRYPNWKLPPIDLLDPVPKLDIKNEDVKNNSTIIEQTLASFGIESKVQQVMVGPSVTQYALDIALGIKVSKIASLRNDLALALATAANAVRIEAPIPDTSYIGIEIPNARRRPVFFRELVADPKMDNPKFMLPVSVGKDIAGGGVVADIQKMPHLLIAGATGSGKSVLTNSFILSLLMKRTPDEVRFILVDPKQVELSDYNGIPHLLTPVIVEMDKVLNALKWSVAEMERRYTIFRESQVKSLEGYNQKMGFNALPFIVIVIDEMADMMLTAGRADLETNIVRLAQKARATGIHLILATQRPSVNVITGLIKANIPGRVGMSVTTQIDSRVILDVIGAESLLGKGDLLFKEPDKNKPYRVQGVFVNQEEIQRVVSFIKDQSDTVEYLEEIVANKDDGSKGSGADGMALSGDDMFSDAVRVIVAAQKGSASLIQRKLSLGYNRAAKLMDQMEELGIVGPPNGAKPRDVLITDAEGFLQSLQGQ